MSEASEARIDPRVFHEVAAQHDAVADVVDTARLAGGDIHAAVSSYGPIMHQVKAAVADVLAARDGALQAHVDAHRGAAENLRASAAGYVATDEANAERLRRLER